MASTSDITRAREEVTAWHPGQIWHPPSTTQKWADRIFRQLCVVFAAATIALSAMLVLEIGVQAIPAFREYGVGFLYRATWDPNKANYGILPEIWGTLYTSLLALGVGTLFGVAAAIFLSEGYLGEAVFRLLKVLHLDFHPIWGKLPSRIETILKTLIELLAAVPSVVYGLWGLFVV